MSLESWCCLLTLDFYLEICHVVGCSVETEEEQVSRALSQSIIFNSDAVAHSVTSRDRENEEVREKEKVNEMETEKEKEKVRVSYVSQSFTSPNRYVSTSTSTSSSTSTSNLPHYNLKDPGSVPPISSLWDKTKGDLVSSSILNPYLKRSLVKSEELESISSLFVEARRSVKDLQAVLLLQLARIALTDSSPSPSSFSSPSSFPFSSPSPPTSSSSTSSSSSHHQYHHHHQFGSIQRYSSLLLFLNYHLILFIFGLFFSSVLHFFFFFSYTHKFLLSDFSSMIFFFQSV